MVWVSVERLLQLWNPLEVAVVFRLESAITLEEISCAIACEQFERHPLPDCLITLEPPERSYHIGRIAWLVVRGWNDPILIDVGCPSFGYFPDWAIGDGNHRLSAAIYRGDRMIACEIAGEQEEIDALLLD